MKCKFIIEQADTEYTVNLYIPTHVHTHARTRTHTTQFLSYRSSKSTGFFIQVGLAIRLSQRHCLVMIMVNK
jgi:hypothetical protein